MLFINKTQLLSKNDNLARSNFAGNAIAEPNNVSKCIAVPNISPTQIFVFASISVKSAGVEDWIVSPAGKIFYKAGNKIYFVEEAGCLQFRLFSLGKTVLFFVIHSDKMKAFIFIAETGYLF